MEELSKKLKKFKDISVKLTLSERFEDAEKMCAAALEMLEQAEESEQKAVWASEIRSAFAAVKMAEKDFEGAAGEYFKAVESLISLPLCARLAFAYDNLAKALKAKGDAEGALECKKSAVKILVETMPEASNVAAKKYFEIASELEALNRASEAIEMRRLAREAASK
ncbi:MAG: hypothetical protein J6P03_09415 [Opitutales bacterium]|nr:hypothetical protein [Opitutales bacterium]